MNNKNLFAAATLGLMMGACASKTASTDQAANTAAKAPTGECWGVNSCKGTGDCGGKHHSCAGKNSCKGKGWKKMTQSDCTAKKGKFKAG